MRLAPLLAPLIAVSLSFEVALAAPSASKPDQAPKVVLQDVEARGVSKADASVLTGSVCQALAKVEGISVLCGEDLRAMLQFAALSASFDTCDDGDCSDRIAKALDARFLVTGNLSKLGETHVLQLSLFDGQAGEVIGRAEIEGAALDRLQADVSEAVDDLTKRLRARK